MNENERVPIETLSWEQLQQYVYEVDGSWRDTYVLNATWADWQTWAGFVNANCRAKELAFTDGDTVRLDRIDFAAMEHLWDSHGQANGLWASFLVGEISIRCHFFRDDEVENDFDPRKITSPAVHLQLMDYLTKLSQALGKEVVLTWENDTPAACSPRWGGVWQPLLAVSGEQIQVHPYWRKNTSY
ncbi:hypothetical protein [Hymenobacter convexus]|uniref:hypothetical protein n=1 Tax=Hymenobacter sp. CA1UV-4 TaxID=3063782 RepID=UPI0027127309|nr:hypothetical protein [Hymenobacter sp. CA1UV-4]MDO7854753.1 hypothetical protein [Hymenobacter sp. CA1UV-4]